MGTYFCNGCNISLDPSLFESTEDIECPDCFSSLTYEPSDKEQEDLDQLLENDDFDESEGIGDDDLNGIELFDIEDNNYD